MPIDGHCDRSITLAGRGNTMRPHCGSENTAETRSNRTWNTVAARVENVAIDFSCQPQKPNRPPTPFGPSPLRYPAPAPIQLRLN